MGGISVRKILNAAGLAASSYYYRPSKGKPGRKPSTHTLRTDGKSVSNETVVAQIRELLSRRFVHYGYETVCHWLRQQGYLINRKKVYRLMREYKLLNAKRRPDRKGKEWVKYRVPKPERVFQHIEGDIKFIWVEGKKRNAKMLSFIDVYTQKIVGCTVDYSIKADNVVALLAKILKAQGKRPKVTIRTDNGSEFSAFKVRNFLKAEKVNHEFTHIATPEENGHIEGFHSVLAREALKGFAFDSLVDLRRHIRKYIYFYNNERLHRSLGFVPPNTFISNIQTVPNTSSKEPKK